MDNIKSFDQLGINSEQLPGSKIGISHILNKQILVTAFRVDPSKYPKEGNGLCLTIQFMLDDIQRIVFTSSTILQNQIHKADKADFPFKATIITLTPRGFKFT